MHNLENQIKSVLKVPLFSLQSILNNNLSKDDRLDFFDIDVEGFDLEVLKTNDWIKFRPKIIVIETDVLFQNDINSDIVKYLESVNYRLIAKTVFAGGDVGNLFLIDNQK